jgi:hypothetical protein
MCALRRNALKMTMHHQDVILMMHCNFQRIASQCVNGQVIVDLNQALIQENSHCTVQARKPSRQLSVLQAPAGAKHV